MNILNIEHISKIYGEKVIFDDVSLGIHSGDKIGVIGVNGTGKTTLLKIIAKINEPDKGQIICGNGIRVSYLPQNPEFPKKQSILEYVMDGKEHQDWKTESEAKTILTKLGIYDFDEKVEHLSGGQRKRVALTSVLLSTADLLILDEPTAVLTPQETEELFEQLKLLRENGHTIIFISHKLNEVKALCNRMTILRDGKTMGTYEISDLDEQEISRLMVGRDVSLNIEKEEMEFGKNVFSVKDLVYVDQFGKTRLDHVSFTIKEGQILGIAGIDGNGQSELVEAIVGTLKQQQGAITMNGKDISNAPVLARQEAGISHVSEDRMKFGTAPKLSLEDNAISKVYYTDKLKTHGLLDSKKISEFTNRILKEFLVKYDNSKQSIAELSGGNVQKVVVGREFDYEPDLLIMNQPTRGIDVGAIEFIRKKIVDMRSRKKAILLVSADLSEILSLSDTILVMHEGRIVGHISDVKNTSENELGLYMLGVKEDSKEQIGGAYCE